MAAGSRVAATLTRPSLRLLYSTFGEPEFDIADCRLATRCHGPSLVETASRRIPTGQASLFCGTGQSGG